MLHIIHGDDTVSSRKELYALKERFSNCEIIELDGKRLTELDLTQALDSQTLFGSDRLIIIERFLRQFGKGKTKELDQYLPIMTGTNHTVILWEDKEIGKILLKKFPPPTDIALFKPSQLLFRFLESLAPGKGTTLLRDFDILSKTQPIELILYLLVRQIRFLLLTKSNEKVKQLAPWQYQRFVRQAKLFTVAQLRQLYTYLFHIDTQHKQGRTPFELTQALEMFLIAV